MNAIVHEALPTLASRATQWSRKMGQSLADVGFILAHKTSTVMMDEVRAMGREEDMFEGDGAYVVMTVPRELLRKWCCHLEAADFAERLGDDPGQIPVLVTYNETRATLTWIQPRERLFS